ncbi:MAG: hypothetical protein WC401_03555 [Bacteroidales bacterium]|jgi:predicted nucleic acid-binding Zn ribbon protein
MIRITIEIDEKTHEVFVSQNGNGHAVKSNSDRNSVITTKEKTCKVCGKTFIPTGNRQVRCSEACGMKPKVYVPKTKRQTLNEVLREVESSQSKPIDLHGE